MISKNTFIANICLATIALIIFLSLGTVIQDKKELFFDSQIIHFIYSFRSPVLTQIMQSITFLGGDIFLGTAIVITCFFLWWKRKKDAVMFGYADWTWINAAA